MRSISLERTEKKSFYEFKNFIPIPKSEYRLEVDKSTESEQVEPVDEVSHLSLLKSLGQDAIELSFSSISDVSIECVQMHDNSAQRTMKALLLTVTSDDGKRKFYLIDLKDLKAGFSKSNEGEAPEGECVFENLYHNLSLREQEVLRAVSRGNTSNEIASNLFISTNTVKNHRKNIKRKLDFNDNQDYSRFLKWSLEYCDKRI